MKSSIFSIFFLFLIVSCDGDLVWKNPYDPNADSSQFEMGSHGGKCYPNNTCDEGLVCNKDKNVCTKEPDNQDGKDSNDTSSDDDKWSDNDTSDTDTGSGNSISDTDTGEQCAETEGLGCSMDEECGPCMICVTGGKCAKGCTSDDDCQMLAGLKCNKKLARCLNTYASNKACSEKNCPGGCCYAEEGLSALKCQKKASPHICGLCRLGEIFSYKDSKCLPAICSTVTDNCPTINAGASKPRCYECKAGEFICKASSSTSGCSAGTLINMQECTPSGMHCIESISQCCSGSPCINGFCY